MKNIVNIHREKALSAFRKAMQSAEASLTTAKSKSPNSIEEAHELLDIAELHLCTLESTKAEIEFTKALDLFYLNSDEDNEKVCIIYISYILKTLSGIYSCQGRKKEAEVAMKNAFIWENKLTMSIDK